MIGEAEKKRHNSPDFYFVTFGKKNSNEHMTMEVKSEKVATAIYLALRKVAQIL